MWSILLLTSFKTKECESCSRHLSSRSWQCKNRPLLSPVTVSLSVHLPRHDPGCGCYYHDNLTSPPKKRRRPHKLIHLAPPLMPFIIVTDDIPKPPEAWTRTRFLLPYPPSSPSQCPSYPSALLLHSTVRDTAAVCPLWNGEGPMVHDL